MVLSALAETTFIHTGFFTGTSVTALVPGYLPIAIAGHPYLIDPEHFQRQTLDTLRTQADQSGEPGEASFNPKGLWRRSQESWHHGAGQNFLDRAISGGTSDRARFRTSKGISPWTEGQISLLADTANRRSTSNTNLHLAVAGTYLYASDGTELYFTTDPTVASPTWTAAAINAGQAAQTVNSIATDGYHIWAALGTSGLHRTTRGATSSTADVPATACTLVGWALGRLLIANANVLYEVRDPLGTPTAAILQTHPNSDFTWDVIAPGRNVIYAAGSSGGTSEIYRITIETTTTNLAAPTFATYLPDGEQLYDLAFYAGSVILATSGGVRLASADSQGNLDYGRLVPAASPVRCLEPQDRYVWYGLTNFDTASTGLGRIDLGYLVDQLVPAYASDLMATGQGNVTSAVTFGTRRYFAVSALGVFGEATTKVASGTLETGVIRYGTTESKTARTVEIRHHALAGTVGVEQKVDGGSYVTLGSSSDQGSGGPSSPISAHSIGGETFELRFTLTRSATDTTAGPELVRWTLRALPTPAREEVFALPLILRTKIDNGAGDGQPVYVDVRAEYAFLKSLERTGQIVTLQLGLDTYEVFLDRVSQQGSHWNARSGAGREYLEGTVMVLCQTVST